MKLKKNDRIPSIKKLKETLWELCKQITRLHCIKDDGTWRCYTCDKFIGEPGSAHTGHMIPSSTAGVEIRYHLDNLRVQDYDCNINKGGSGAEFHRRLIKEIGKKRVDFLFYLKNHPIQADSTWYLNKISEYTAILNKLKGNCDII